MFPRGLFNREVDKKLFEKEKRRIKILPKSCECPICFVYLTVLKRHYISCINNCINILLKVSILNREITAKPTKPVKTCTDCHKIYKILHTCTFRRPINLIDEFNLNDDLFKFHLFNLECILIVFLSTIRLNFFLIYF